MGFEKFEYKRNNALWTNVPIVNIMKSGHFIFNTKTVAMFEDGLSIELYFDREKRKIGIKSFKDKKLGRYTITTARYQRQICPISFLNHYEITENGHYRVKLEEGMLVINLTAPIKARKYKI